MALGVSDEIIVSYIQQQPRFVWVDDQPQHMESGLVFSADVAVAEVAHIDALVVELPRHVDAYERYYDIQRLREAPEISMLEGGVIETVFLDKYDCPWVASTAVLWQPWTDWRSREHASILGLDESFVVDTFLAWVVPDGGRFYHAVTHEETLRWMAGNATLVLTNTQATTGFPLGNVHYTGGRITLT